MVDQLSFLIAIVLGFLAGLGVGGGSLLMLWLTMVAQVDHSIARTINLLFFLPSAAIATFFHRKQGTVDFQKILPAIICGCISAGVFTLIGTHLNTELVKKLFGGLLIMTGIHELFYRPRKAK